MNLLFLSINHSGLRIFRRVSVSLWQKSWGLHENRHFRRHLQSRSKSPISASPRRCGTASTWLKVVFVPAATPPHKPLAGGPPLCAPLRDGAAGDCRQPGLFPVGHRRATGGKVLFHRHAAAPSGGSSPATNSSSSSAAIPFIDLGSWREYAAIFSLCNIVVVETPGTRQLPGARQGPAGCHGP